MNYIKTIITLLIITFMTNCGGPKSNMVVIIEKDNSISAVGALQVKFNGSRAYYDYFVPGAIVALKTDYTILKQQGKAGKVYQITVDSTLYEIGSIDPAMNDSLIKNKYLIKGIEIE